MKYRKKPVVIDAIQWTGNNFKEVTDFFGEFKRWHISDVVEVESIFIDTLEGRHEARKGDWIIKGVKGEFYPCKPDIFEQTYEKIDAPADNTQFIMFHEVKMTSITFVCSDKDKDRENFTRECAENIAEWILDNSGLKGFCDRILINNKEVWKVGDKTICDILTSQKHNSRKSESAIDDDKFMRLTMGGKI